MRTLVMIVSVIVVLTAVVAKYPEVTSWGLPELEMEILGGSNLDVSMRQCLKLAYNVFRVGMLNRSPSLRESVATLEGEDTIALIPSPQGHHTWNVDDLRAAAKVIVRDNMGPEYKFHRRAHDKNNLFYKVKDAFNILSTNMKHIQKRNTVDLINLKILEKLYSIMTLSDDEVAIAKKTEHQIIMPIIDVTMWDSNDLHKELNKGKFFFLTIFLNDSFHGMMAPHATLANGKICVITPVNVIPEHEAYYYVPPATKRLLYKANGLLKKSSVLELS